jgi:hypothetical protein
MLRPDPTCDPTIRRRPDGSIDTARYVSRALTLRAEKARRVLSLAWPAASAVLAQDAAGQVEGPADQDARRRIIGNDRADRF